MKYPINRSVQHKMIVRTPSERVSIAFNSPEAKSRFMETTAEAAAGIGSPVKFFLKESANT
ncbi:MAG: hypothetical protein ACXU9U_02740 [Parachlamydiaceae bacterium]